MNLAGLLWAWSFLLICPQMFLSSFEKFKTMHNRCGFMLNFILTIFLHKGYREFKFKIHFKWNVKRHCIFNRLFFSSYNIYLSISIYIDLDAATCNTWGLLALYVWLKGWKGGLRGKGVCVGKGRGEQVEVRKGVWGQRWWCWVRFKGSGRRGRNNESAETREAAWEKTCRPNRTEDWSNMEFW